MASFKFASLLFVLFVLSNVNGNDETTIASSTTSTEKPKELCVLSTPCGWAIYHRYTRDIDYFMKNNCECPTGKKCIRTDDDISVTAYVYRCKESAET